MSTNGISFMEITGNLIKSSAVRVVDRDIQSDSRRFISEGKHKNVSVYIQINGKQQSVFQIRNMISEIIGVSLNIKPNKRQIDIGYRALCLSLKGNTSGVYKANNKNIYFEAKECDPSEPRGIDGDEIYAVVVSSILENYPQLLQKWRSDRGMTCG